MAKRFCLVCGSLLRRRLHERIFCECVGSGSPSTMTLQFKSTTPAVLFDLERYINYPSSSACWSGKIWGARMVKGRSEPVEEKSTHLLPWEVCRRNFDRRICNGEFRHSWNIRIAPVYGWKALGRGSAGGGARVRCSAQKVIARYRPIHIYLTSERLTKDSPHEVPIEPNKLIRSAHSFVSLRHDILVGTWREAIARHSSSDAVTRIKIQSTEREM